MSQVFFKKVRKSHLQVEILRKRIGEEGRIRVCKSVGWPPGPG